MGKVVKYICDYCGEEIILNENELNIYRRKYYHGACLITKLKKSRRPKYSQEDIDKIYNETKYKEKPSKVRMPKVNKETYMNEKRDAENLIKFLEIKYNIPVTSMKYLTNTINAIHNGNYKKAFGKKVPYDTLYKMFTFYESDLQFAHRNIISKVENGYQLFAYDIMVILSKADDFMYLQNQKPESSTAEQLNSNVDVVNYLNGRILKDEENEEDDISLDAFLDDY